jgi:hypothetical protein
LGCGLLVVLRRCAARPARLTPPKSCRLCDRVSPKWAGRPRQRISLILRARCLSHEVETGGSLVGWLQARGAATIRRIREALPQHRTPRDRSRGRRGRLGRSLRRCLNDVAPQRRRPRSQARRGLPARSRRGRGSSGRSVSPLSRCPTGRSEEQLGVESPASRSLVPAGTVPPEDGEKVVEGRDVVEGGHLRLDHRTEYGFGARGARSGEGGQLQPSLQPAESTAIDTGPMSRR